MKIFLHNLILTLVFQSRALTSLVKLKKKRKEKKKGRKEEKGMKEITQGRLIIENPLRTGHVWLIPLILVEYNMQLNT